MPCVDPGPIGCWVGARTTPKDFMQTDQISASLQAALDTTLTMVSTWGVRVLGALALLLVGRIAAGWVRRNVVRGLQQAME